MNGAQNSGVALNSSNASNSTGSGAGGSGGSIGGAANGGIPMIGSFIRNISNAPRMSRSAAIQRSIKYGSRTRGGNFYYDEWLQLWVDFTDLPGSTTYLFYLDEAKTQPAGSNIATYPVDFSVFPQKYESSYNFTAGTAAGSHGKYVSSYNADGSGSTSYDNSWNDGSTYSGTSTSTADGTYKWSNHSSFGSVSFNDSGTFKSDGSGMAHTDSSDGHATDFVFNADGSGWGKFSGPEPGLPAIIRWDATGVGTITYADGTSEPLPFFMFGGVAYAGVSESAVKTTDRGTLNSSKTKSR